jgi:hypothetical protein
VIAFLLLREQIALRQGVFIHLDDFYVKHVCRALDHIFYGAKGPLFLFEDAF